jgi:uncharacterized membrane protein YgdD (TMEM256/DUF423 family)
VLPPGDNDYRYITIIGILQTVAVIFGVLLVFAATRNFLEIHSFAQLPKGAQLVRTWGLALLLIPLAWVAGSIITQWCPVHPSLPRIMLVLGILLFVGLILVFCAGAMSAVPFVKEPLQGQ